MVPNPAVVRGGERADTAGGGGWARRASFLFLFFLFHLPRRAGKPQDLLSEVVAKTASATSVKICVVVHLK